MTHITEKNQAWKIGFSNETQRQNAFIKLKECGFNIDNYDPELVNDINGFLFISTYDNVMIGCWDTLDVFLDNAGRCKMLTYESLIEMCNYKGSKVSEKANKKVWDPVSRHINRSRTHYLKWDLTKDISIRYHYLHQGNRELEGQFIIKIHSNGSYQLVDRTFAKKMILSYKRETCAPNTEDALVEPDYEITGRLMKCPLTNRIEFHKTTIELRTMITHFAIDINEGLKTMSYGLDGELCFREENIARISNESFHDQLEKIKELEDKQDLETMGMCYYPKMDASKIVYKPENLCSEVSLDPNTEEALQYATDVVGEIKTRDKLKSEEVVAIVSNIMNSDFKSYYSTEKAIVAEEDPNDIKSKSDKDGLPINSQTIDDYCKE